MIEIIHQYSHRRSSIQPDAQICLRTNATYPRGCIRCVIRRVIRYVDSIQVEIEEMIDNVHTAICRCARRSIDRALWECWVCSIVGRFEKVSEFVQDVWYGRAGASVEERDEARPGCDHFLQRRPCTKRKRRGWRDIRIRLEPAGCVRVVEHTDGDIVAVDE